MKYILPLILLIGFNTVFAQTRTDSLKQYLKYEHDKNVHGYHLERKGITNGKILLLLKKDTIKLNFDSSQTNLFSQCLGDVGYSLCQQLYRAYSTKKENSFDFKTFGTSNSISINLNGILYGYGYIPYDTSVHNLMKEILFTYTYIGKKKYLTLKIIKPIKLEINFNGHKINTLMEKENMSYKRARKLYKPITILPGSFIIICIEEK